MNIHNFVKTIHVLLHFIESLPISRHPKLWHKLCSDYPQQHLILVGYKSTFLKSILSSISQESPIPMYPMTFPILLPWFAIYGYYSSCIYNIWHKSSISIVWLIVYLGIITAWNVTILLNAFSQKIHVLRLGLSIIGCYVVDYQTPHILPSILSNK